MVSSLKLVCSSPSRRDKQSDVMEWGNPSLDWCNCILSLNVIRSLARYELTFMAFFTYSMGLSMAIWYFLRTSLARALNPVPGNQSGTYRTVRDVVSGRWVMSGYRDARMGMVSTRNFPGTIADDSVCAALTVALRNGSSVDLGSIP